MGKPNASIPVYCVELDREFPSLNDCAKKLGISNANLRKVVKGQRNVCSGYHFRLVNPVNGGEGNESKNQTEGQNQTQPESTISKESL